MSECLVFGFGVMRVGIYGLECESFFKGGGGDVVLISCLRKGIDWFVVRVLKLG